MNENEQKKDKEVLLLHENHCSTCRCYSNVLGRKYEDRYGDVWKRTSDTTVRRVSDGNIGHWFLGKGLNLIER